MGIRWPAIVMIVGYSLAMLMSLIQLIFAGLLMALGYIYAVGSLVHALVAMLYLVAWYICLPPPIHNANLTSDSLTPGSYISRNTIAHSFAPRAT